MKAGTTIMAFNGDRAVVMLHGEVIPDCPGTVANKIEGLRKPAAREKVMKEVIKRSLNMNT